MHSLEKCLMNCPGCQSRKVVASRWRRYEWPLWLLGAKPLRCRTCYHRFISWFFLRVPASRAAAQ